MSSVTQTCSVSSAGLVSGNGDDLRWYAIHTRARHEKKIHFKLQQEGWNAFLPLLTEVHRWSDRRKSVELPLFPCYLFVKVSDLDCLLPVLYRIPGIIGLVGNGGKGAAIPDEQIEGVRTVLTRQVAFAEHPFLKVGQRVRVRSGPLEGVEGILVEGRNRHLVISIDTIQQALIVTIDGYDVQAL